jgi:hypothetical protein
VPLIWNPITKLVSPQFHVVFYDNFETVKPPNPDMKIDDMMDPVFKTNNYKCDDPFENTHPYLFSYVGVDIHPDSLSPDIKNMSKVHKHSIHSRWIINHLRNNIN